MFTSLEKLNEIGHKFYARKKTTPCKSTNTSYKKGQRLTNNRACPKNEILATGLYNPHAQHARRDGEQLLNLATVNTLQFVELISLLQQSVCSINERHFGPLHISQLLNAFVQLTIVVRLQCAHHIVPRLLHLKARR